QPTGLSHDAFGRIVVTNAGNHTVRIFPAGATGNVRPVRVLSGVGSAAGNPAAVSVYGVHPSRPTELKATLHGTVAHLSWKAPAVTGGHVVGYDVLAATGTGGNLSVAF